MTDFFKNLPQLHPEGVRFVAIFAGVMFILLFIWPPLGLVGLVLTLWCIYFFRDPERVTPQRSGLVIAPADGVICAIERAPLPKELNHSNVPVWRISIFMSVFNVHVNRTPAAGKIIKLHYIKGKFFNASLDKASEDNERQIVLMKTNSGLELGFVQIAGLLARRIVCTIREGQHVKAGARFGIIRFGSRVDVYLDNSLEPLVNVGQTTIAGETVLADSYSRKRMVRRGIGDSHGQETPNA